MIDKEKIRQKIHFMRKNIKLLKDLSRMPYEKFSNSIIDVHAAERMLQITIESMIDVANHIVSREGLGIPKSYRESLEILCSEDILDKKMLDTYVRMIKFRNRLVHLYDDIEVKELYDIINNNLGDFECFIISIVKRYF